MKKLAKKITALGLTAAMAMGLCLTARATTNWKGFTSSKKPIIFRLTISSSTLAGAAYQLKSSVEEIPNETLYINPYYYPACT